MDANLHNSISDDDEDESSSDDTSDDCQSNDTDIEEDEEGSDDMDHKIHLALKAIHAANSCAAKENYGRAFAYYLLALQLQPNCRDSIRSHFIIVCRKWCDELEALGKIDDMFNCYENARQALPDCEEIYNNIGAKLFKFGHRNSAIQYFHKALQINPQLARATENLQNISNLLVERWHFCMLNDITRNSSYRDAIDRAIASDARASVLDIGSGSGILSMLAVKAGAKDVYACEMSDVWHDISKQVLLDNCMDKNVKLIKAKSTNLMIPEDIPDRVSLVVTETLDSGVLGEGIIKFIQHAWRDLLTVNTAPVQDDNITDSNQLSSHIDNKKNHPVGKVIPAGVTIYICAIECEYIRRESRLLHSNIQGLDVSKLRLIGNSENMAINKVDDYMAEPYTTERLAFLPGGCKYLTDVCSILHLDFNYPHILHPPMYLNKKFKLKLDCVQTGRIDAIAMWFNLQLDDKIAFTTSPGSNLSWEQAIYPINSSSLMDKIYTASVVDGNVNQTEIDKLLTMQSQDMVEISIQCTPKYVDLEVENIYVYNKQLNCNTIRLPNQSAFFHGPASELFEHYIDRRELCRLNDSVYHSRFSFAIKDLIQKMALMKQSEGNDSTIKVMDLMQGVSLIGILAAQQGAEVMIVDPPNDFEQLYSRIIEYNDIKSKISPGCGDFEQDIKHFEWDILLSEIVEPSGVLKEQILEDIHLARQIESQRKRFVIPNKITVYGLCISSLPLRSKCLVLDDNNTLGFRIKDFINEYRVITHIDIDLANLPHERLSLPFKILTIDLNCEDTMKMLVQKSVVPVNMIKSGNLTAVVYWFVLDLDDTHKISTGPNAYETSFWHQAGVVFKTETAVQCDQKIILSCSLSISTLDIIITKDE
ncbi:uncharacterized protein TRIADDRAFT_56661 [Trichoplax adhaerens]|uniref:Protein arginine N-methyltransferase domain-containing protein n=1 Tax=Trichoplax adhaerens TaxID=10228 RepID=B3RYS7_TRIAD|nr:hypothetical protein TRIADDRAFT_56661 [Trichoplax adhaerens]EDV24647.1 hypothetical protein TRIADDRAFT_56661 [Trichoplax adhaerens]|eukprot:XP_002112537.1 hypothetical protein TRIADDRAFT_56661 [Trichoplax adhaerens]